MILPSIQPPHYVVCGQDVVEALKQEAERSPLRRARRSLHCSTNAAVQEMLIVLCADTVVVRHRHPGRTESFHIVEGIVDVVFFDDGGLECERLRLGDTATGYAFLYRLNSPLWHTVLPVTAFAVIHEVLTGPYTPTSNEVWEA